MNNKTIYKRALKLAVPMMIQNGITNIVSLIDNVMVGSGAKVLGPFKIGNNARIAANSVVLREVPENATVVGVPGRIARICGEKLDHIHTPDPVMIEIEMLKMRLDALEHKTEE